MGHSVAGQGEVGQGGVKKGGAGQGKVRWSRVWQGRAVVVVVIFIYTSIGHI